MNSPLPHEKEPARAYRPVTGSSPYTDEHDRSRHQHNIAQLAQETGMPVEELAPLYEEVLAGFNSRARIHDYVPILVSKNIKDLLRRH